VDAAGVQRFALLGISQGGPVAIEYAARHPERVSHLVLYGAFSKRVGGSPEERDALITLYREGWGRDDAVYRQMATTRVMPSASQAEMQAWNQEQLLSVNGEVAALMTAAMASVDLTARLPGLREPTLVLHSLGDAAVPFSEGRRIASLIPNARLVALESQNHALLAREPAWPVLLSEVRAFLAGGPETAAADNDSGLSRREVEVLRLIAAGKSNPQIADELVISINTVQRHVSNIFAKIGAANRTEAAGYATRNGLA